MEREEIKSEKEKRFTAREECKRETAGSKLYEAARPDLYAAKNDLSPKQEWEKTGGRPKNEIRLMIVLCFRQNKA